MEDWVKAISIAIIASIGTVLGFCPRLSRAEQDIKNKLDKEVFTEVRKHIDDKFESQEKLLHQIHSTIKKEL